MATEFQSKTFKSGFSKWENFEAFRNDLEIVNKIDFKSQISDSLIDHVIQYILAKTNDEERKIIEETIKSKLVSNKDVFKAIFRFARIFFEIFIDEDTKDDNPGVLLEDLSIELKVDKSELATIKVLLETIKNKSTYYEKIKNKEKSRVGVLPYLRGFDTTVDLRGIFNKELGLGDDLDLYFKEVKVEGKPCPIISVAISLDSGTPDKFYFQASPESINHLINELKAAVYNSEILQKRFKFE